MSGNREGMPPLQSANKGKEAVGTDGGRELLDMLPISVAGIIALMIGNDTIHFNSSS